MLLKFKYSNVPSCTAQTLQIWETWFSRLFRSSGMTQCVSYIERWRQSKQESSIEKLKMGIQTTPLTEKSWIHSRYSTSKTSSPCFRRELRNRKPTIESGFRSSMARELFMEHLFSSCIKIVACSSSMQRSHHSLTELVNHSNWHTTQVLKELRSTSSRDTGTDKMENPLFTMTTFSSTTRSTTHSSISQKISSKIR